LVLRQFVDDDLGCASYLIGDSEAGEALVVDPAYAIEQYLAAAEEEGVRIVRVLETHTHADHVSGHGRFALEHGVPVSIHPAAEPQFPFDPLAEGQVLEVGATRVRVVHTPGHRPEHCAFVVDERAVLTGDSLLVGDAARPDLAVEAREGAQDLFRSLRRLVELPAETTVYPGHVAGSLCGADLSPARSSTIAAERGSNRALRLSDEEAFVADSAAVTIPRPPTTARVVELNRGPFLGAQQSLAQVDPSGDATVLDVRPADEHWAGHLRGAISVPVSGPSFATKAGFLLDPDERVVLHASSPAEAEAAARGLWSIGLFELAGYFTDGDAPERSTVVPVDDLAHLLDEGSVQVLDVREKSERDSGYIPGTLHVPYRLLRACGGDGLDPERPVVTICESGARAGVAASVLAAAGLDARPVLDGGINDWRGPMVEFRRCGS
jgi:glyoxylase-like metal-dependent hydrolase (beta-lactamase superfamily II)/rhodanese-related sulfurtransferase